MLNTIGGEIRFKAKYDPSTYIVSTETLEEFEIDHDDCNDPDVTIGTIVNQVKGEIANEIREGRGVVTQSLEQRFQDQKGRTELI